METLQTPPSQESSGTNNKKRRKRGERKKGTHRGPKKVQFSNDKEDIGDQTVVISCTKGQNFEEFAKSIIMHQKDMWDDKIGNECEEIIQEDIIVPQKGYQFMNDQKLSTDESANSITDSLASQNMVMYK